MKREELTNSQEYKAEGLALNWYKSLSPEQVGDIHITDAYADGVIYGWNNPNWISVEERLPTADGQYLVVSVYGFVSAINFDAESKYWWIRNVGRKDDYVTHWMSLPVPPRKYDDNE